MALNGITVELETLTAAGTVDGFGRPTYTSAFVNVNDVLVSPMSTAEILDTLNLTGRKAVYQLAIPKGDTHIWANRRVKFFGQTFKTIGEPIKGIDAMIPLRWNTKVQVEIIE